jgi:hypothetical protein
MNAIVIRINFQKGMYAAEIDGSGEFVIFELLDSSEPELGDTLRCDDFWNLGGGDIYNISQQCRLDVVIEDVCGAELINKRLLF